MIRMIGKRLLEVIPTLLILSVIIFVLQRLLPGDPALALAGEDADRELIEQIRQQYGLNQPLPVQYFKWSGGILYGDLGQSMRMNRPVLDLILARLPVTLQLAVFSMIIALAVGITAGIIAAVRKQSAWDYGANLVALAGISVPNFWLGIMMILVFSVMLNWLPASGYVSPLIDPLRSLQSLLMPSIVLGTAIAGVIMRHTRSAMLQALESDYVRTAREGACRMGGGGPPRNAQCANPGDHPWRTRIRQSAGRRCAYRTDLQHPRLWQAHRRCGV